MCKRGKKKAQKSECHDMSWKSAEMGLLYQNIDPWSCIENNFPGVLESSLSSWLVCLSSIRFSIEKCDSFIYLFLKGIVHQKLSWVLSSINRQLFL
jgi:hypothetical protein